jgi:PleD family two-component response regulator
VVVAEPAAPLAAAYRKFLNGWAEVHVVASAAEAVQAVKARAPDVVLASVSSAFNGEALVAPLRKLAPETALVLAYPVEAVERAPKRAKQLGLDGFVVMPPKQHHVLAIVQAVARLNGLAQQLKRLRASFEELKAAHARSVGPSKPNGRPLNSPDEAFFKKYMLLEVKRSRRYQYPVAVLLVAHDKLQEHLGESAPEFQRAAVRAEALEVLSALVRDIDVAMPFGEEKYLLFLPHTPLTGAQIVASRVVTRLSQLDSLQGGTASVGLASFDPASGLKDQEALSFGGLVRAASERLKRAQEAGGNRVEAPPLPESPKKGKKGKKSRISMG